MGNHYQGKYEGFEWERKRQKHIRLYISDIDINLF